MIYYLSRRYCPAGCVRRRRKKIISESDLNTRNENQTAEKNGFQFAQKPEIA
jgi:hypothetical protein